MKSDIKGIGFLYSLLIFGTASTVLILETQLLIPFLTGRTGLEPVIIWFVVAGLGLFLPLLVLAYLILKDEGLKIGRDTWKDRLRFRKMNRADWLWSIGSIILIGILSLTVIKILELFIGKVNSHPSFMYFEPLTRGRYWILLLWFPYWLLNIMGEEILWRGVILPRQISAFGNKAWLIHGFCWGLFHIAFGWQLLATLIPMLFIQSYTVQRRQNSWIGVVIHALINGPGFLAISLGFL